LYIAPHLLSYFSLSDADFAHQVNELRTRLPEGPLVKVGFTMYILITMDDPTVDISDKAAIRAALAPTVAQMDQAIARALPHNLPICFAMATPIRAAYDALQTAAELEDRRNMQWFPDGGMAAGWVTYSQYARKLRVVQEAYIREMGAILAERMALYPDIVVAAAGDAEIELSYDRALGLPGSSQLADYSPFAVLEFRDWLRNAGLYAAGSSLAGKGYAQAARYVGDASPASDTNGDGHTLNGDFGTAFTSWDLRYFDWSLLDNPANDPKAIPAVVYNASGWNPMPDAGTGRFDAPRTRAPGNAFWEAWVRFKQEMVWRYNVEFSRWITTSPDPVSGAKVPVERWYSYQIPADYLSGSTPETPSWRLELSASPWWTADVTPYGGVGLTSFGHYANGVFYPTLGGFAPQIAARNRRWGLIEWNPVFPAPGPVEYHRQDMAVVEKYRPGLLVPWTWNFPEFPVENTGFEVALRELIDRIKEPTPSRPRMRLLTPGSGQRLQQPFRVEGWAVDLGTIIGPGRHPGVDAVKVEAFKDPGSGQPPVVLSATYGGELPEIGQAFGLQFTPSSFGLTVEGLTPGVYRLVVSARSTVTGTYSQSKVIDVTVDFTPPAGPALTVTRGGTGGGLVWSTPSGLACGAICSSTFDSGTVDLVATADAGSVFAGWGGACTGTGSCQVTMNGAQTITATFMRLVDCPGDLDGDGHADILWRAVAGPATGAMFVWLMTGNDIVGATYLDPISSDWVIQATGDLNQDGRADVLWRNMNPAAPDAGDLYVWLMDGPKVSGKGYTNAQADFDWQVQAIGDLDGDKRQDIVWRAVSGPAKGALFVWLMDGTQVKGATYLEPISSDWVIQRIGDLDGDGKADILWRNLNASAVDGGSLYVWLMDGPTVKAKGYTNAQADFTWQVQAIGDLDGDGKSDIVWRAVSGPATGALFVWLMNGTAVKGATYLDPIATDWQIQGMADYSGDGRADILWRNVNAAAPDAARLYLWVMDGPKVAKGTGYTTVNTDFSWAVRHPK
jgi:expansin (peptidoglycan-binding protein)